VGETPCIDGKPEITVIIARLNRAGFFVMDSGNTEGKMKRFGFLPQLVLICLLQHVSHPASGNLQAQAISARQPITVAYYYKIKWGYQDEFLELFKRNHYPVLEAQVKAGRMLKVEAYTPRFHGDGRSDWHFMTILVFKDWESFGDNTGDADLIKKLYPDQDKFKKEEQRRFQLLEAHWDVPLNSAPMK
jgi:hypothetical protein